MSKLEEALKQAILERSKNQNSEDASKELVKTNASSIRETDTSLISSMNENKLIERDEMEKERIIFPNMHNGKIVDQFREVRTSIYQALHKDNSPILITAVSGKAGNTFVTKNIAAAIALDNARTSLIVDCNLTCPGFMGVLQVADQKGITDYIEGGISLENIIQPMGIPRMRLISSGAKKESVTDYLTSARLKDLFSELQERYSDRVILVDSPSINDSADAKILANFFSHVILVIPYRQVTETQIANAIKTIGKEKIIGMVINREPRFLSLFKFSH